MKIFIFILAFFFQLNFLFSQENFQDLSKKENKKRISKEHLFTDFDGNVIKGSFSLNFPFWGHVQQYKTKDNHIIVTFPDLHAELYENRKLIQKIQCDITIGVVYKEKIKKIECSIPVSTGLGIVLLGFKKDDLFSKGKTIKYINSQRVTIISKSTGFYIEIEQDKPFDKYMIKNYGEYNYKFSEKPFIYIKLCSETNDNSKTSCDIVKESLDNYEILDGFLSYYKRPWSPNALPKILVYESEKALKADLPCREYLYNLLGDNKLQCPYFVPFRDDYSIENINRILNEKYISDDMYLYLREYLFKPIVYDYSLPHEVKNIFSEE